MTPSQLIAAFERLAEAPDAINRLRDLVLQLAVRGKLVPQAPNDEPASVLLGRIGSRTSAKVKALCRVDDSEAPFPLPAGWCWIRFGALMDIQGGSQPPKSTFRSTPGPGLVRLLQIRDFGNKPVPVFVPVGEVRRKCAVGDVMLARYGASVGKVFMGQDGAYNVALTKVVFDGAGLLNRFVFHLLRSRVFQAHIENASRSAQAGFNKGDLHPIPLPLPPLAEQHRIVARVDELMGLLDRLEAVQTSRDSTRVALRDSSLAALRDADSPEEVDIAWKRVAEHMDDLFTDPSDVEPLRQTVVALASRGRLPSVDADLERSPIEGVPDDLHALPDSWHWKRLGELGTDLKKPVQTGPFGSKLRKDEFVPSGVPVIAVGNLTERGFKVDDKYFVTKEKAAELAAYNAVPGDVLFARSGATLGKVCVTPPYVRDWRMSSHILRLRLDTTCVLPELVVLWLYAAPAVKQQVDERVRGMTRPGFNCSLLESIFIPVPPLEEQHGIVAKVDELMSLLDQVELRLRAAQTTQAAFAAAAVHHLDV